MDAFYAAVEVLADPSLAGKPVIVGGSGSRGVVASCSYEARSYGVHSAMPSLRARRLCPSAVFVAGRYDLYQEHSRRLHEILTSFTPLAEGIALDEAFLDVRGARRLLGTGPVIAAAIRARVHEGTGLWCSVGVATSKFLAKLASQAAKPRAGPPGHPPVPGPGVKVVEPGQELAFLHPLPVERLWGVGRVTAVKLHDRGIRTVGEVAGLAEGALISILGPGAGRHLHALAHNRDPRPVQVGVRRRSIGSQRALGRVTRSPDEIDAVVLGLVDRVTRRLRAAGRAGRTVVVRLRFEDFSRIARSHTLARPTSDTEAVLATVRALLVVAAPLVEQRGLTLVGVAVANLDRDGLAQLTLPFTGRDSPALDAALDQVRDRFGSAALTRAELVGRDPGWSPPLLPD